MIRRLSQLLRRFPFLMRLPYLAIGRLQARFTIGVAAVVLDDEGRTLLVEHAYHPRHPWGLPGGWVDADEAPAAAVVRELREELQLDALALRVVHSARTAPNHIDLAFHCQPKSPIGPLSHELLAYRWVAPGDFPPLKRFHRQSIQAARELAQRSPAWEQV